MSTSLWLFVVLIVLVGLERVAELVVSLRNASTVTYIQPVISDGAPHWLVTFEARRESFDLDFAGVAQLAADLSLISRMCEHLQIKTDVALQMKAAGSAR